MSKKHNVDDTVSYFYTREPLDIRCGIISEIDQLDGELYILTGDDVTMLTCVLPRDVILNIEWVTDELLEI